jgi:hypothetical protein
MRHARAAQLPTRKGQQPLLFLTAILPQFVDPAPEGALQVLILGVSSTVMEFAILFIYGQLAGSSTCYGPQSTIRKDHEPRRRITADWSRSRAGKIAANVIFAK